MSCAIMYAGAAFAPKITVIGVDVYKRQIWYSYFFKPCVKIIHLSTKKN